VPHEAAIAAAAMRAATSDTRSPPDSLTKSACGRFPGRPLGRG
jgi:hypothetical protein